MIFNNSKERPIKTTQARYDTSEFNDYDAKNIYTNSSINQENTFALKKKRFS